MTLEVDPAELSSLGGRFDHLGGDLQAAVTPLTPGPDNQPSSGAVAELAASVDHLTRVAAFRLSGYGNNYVRAATAYEVADAANAKRIGTTLPPGG